MAKRIGLYTAEQIKQLEQLYARLNDGATYRLMERAGGVVYNELRERWPDCRRILVVCGKGNNGGDGFVVARLAASAGFPVTVALTKDADKPSGDAEKAFRRLKTSSASIVNWSPELLENHDVVVDALLGTGIKGDLRADIAEIIIGINKSGLPVIAVDLPSGIIANTGAAAGVAVKAKVTVTFVGIKRGLVTGDAPDHCGELVVNDLKCGQGVFGLVRAREFLFQFNKQSRWLEPRSRTAHKGMFGHTMIIGGAPGFSGAARMSAEAAARTGSGLVSLLTHPQHADLIAMQRPEIMSHSVTDKASMRAMKSLLSVANVIAIGPGLGRMGWGKNLVAMIDDFSASEFHTNNLSMVWDADALNFLAEHPKVNHSRIITPHPGEAARLLNTSVENIQEDRFAACRKLVEKYGGVVVLKGAGTLVMSDSNSSVVCGGNPGMATGGMGDVLTGIIAGLLAQKIPLYDAAQLGVAIHANAADQAVKCGGGRQERGLLASDLFPYIRAQVNP
ncbi:MAG: NAD(P)H-hydrate dehydratase [Gammaproteobacteria bacterium]|nr:NAD(P)H-hydrate dehydratase [Gammaproteobacteria bacterium]